MQRYIIWASNRLQLLQSRSRNMSRDTGTRGYAMAGGRVRRTLGTELRVPTARNLHFIKTSRANRTAPEPGRGIIFALNPLRLIVPRSVIAFRTWPCKETIITMTFESICPVAKGISVIVVTQPTYNPLRRGFPPISGRMVKALPIPSTMDSRNDNRCN